MEKIKRSTTLGAPCRRFTNLLDQNWTYWNYWNGLVSFNRLIRLLIFRNFFTLLKKGKQRLLTRKWWESATRITASSRMKVWRASTLAFAVVLTSSWSVPFHVSVIACRHRVAQLQFRLIDLVVGPIWNEIWQEGVKWPTHTIQYTQELILWQRS